MHRKLISANSRMQPIEYDMILSPDFPDHYKTKILLRLAGHAGVFSLLKLWSQCQFRKCERIEKPADIVAAIADWTGDPDQLEVATQGAKAMRSSCINGRIRTSVYSRITKMGRKAEGPKMTLQSLQKSQSECVCK